MSISKKDAKHLAVRYAAYIEAEVGTNTYFVWGQMLAETQAKIGICLAKHVNTDEFRVALERFRAERDRLEEKKIVATPAGDTLLSTDHGYGIADVTSQNTRNADFKDRYNNWAGAVAVMNVKGLPAKLRWIKDADIAYSVK